MGLDFTKIKDQHGSAIYLLHDGTEQGRVTFEKLAADIAGRTQKQVELLSAKEGDGLAIVKFYQLKGTHFVLIVRDDDQLHHVWSNGDRFDAAQIAYMADQAG